MTSIVDRFETADEILALRPEELGGFVLEHIEAIRLSGSRDSEQPLNMHKITYSIGEAYAQRGFGRIADLRRAIAEAWNWLIVVGLLAFDPESRGALHCLVTRRGVECHTHEGVEEYQKRRLFAPALLNQTIRDCAIADYLAGDFESAILKAYRRIEIEVRAACGYSAGDTGVPLVRKAFHPSPNPGPLTLTSELAGEQQAVSDLFAGAIGRYRNPAAHGTRAFSDSAEAAELLILASHLMTIVEDRKP